MKLKKLISNSLAIGLLINNITPSLASTLSEDGRYETFEGDNITIDNVLEEDKVDIEIEGNTMVNVANQKDAVPVTKDYTVEGTNHIALQGEYDGKARPVIEGNTMYYNNDTGELTDTFIEGANLSLVSSFEDQLVTQEMVNSRQEDIKNLGKYKVELKSTGDGGKESIKTFYLNSPLLEGDTIEDIDGKATHVKRRESITFDGDEDWFKTYESNDSSHVTFQTTVDKLIYNSNQWQKSVLSNKFLPHHWFEIYYDRTSTEVITPCLDDEYAINIRINKSKLQTVDSEGFNKWLKSNNVQVIYILAEPIYETISEESILIDSYKDGHLDLDSNVPVNKVEFRGTGVYVNYLKENTDYTVQFESDNDGYLTFLAIADINSVSNIPVKKGINRVNISTTSSTIPYVHFNGIGFNLSNLVVTQATDESFDYFEGIQSVGQDDENGHKVEIVSINKNLFNATNNTIEDVYGMTEHTYENEILRVYNTREVTFNRCEYSINLKGDTWYTFSCNYNINLGSSAVVTLSNDSYEDIETINEDDKSISFKFLTNSHGKITILFYSTLDTLEIGDVNFYNIQVEENIKSTDYIPHQLNTLQIPLSEPLRSLPNGVKDKIIKKNGQWVVERNIGEKLLNGDDTVGYFFTGYDASYNTTVYYARITFDNLKIDNNIQIINDKFKSVTGDTCSAYEESVYIWGDEINGGLYVQLESNRLSQLNLYGFKEWLLQNPITVVYQLETPIYEPLNISPTIDLYLDTTYISNSSNIPANMKVTVDRTINRATEAIQLAKESPTVENISIARMWANLLKETIKKDEINNEINNITEVEGLQIEKKKVSANVDLYIKPLNSLTMSLSTNSIIFDEYDSTEDIEKLKAVDITVSSSLPYSLSSYLMTEIKNENGSNIIPKEQFNIRLNGESDYKAFNDIGEKLVLKEDCSKGESIYGIDLILKGGRMSEADIYKTTLKFEAEQK